MKIRHATVADVPAEHDVFRAAIGELFRRHAFEPPDPPPEAFAAMHRHLLGHDGERCFVAEEGDRVVGFTAAFARGDTWFLSSLFVLPEAQGRGIGRRLLEHSWGTGYRSRLTLADSIQPVSNGLYARRGLLPVTPVLHLDGEPRVDAPSELEATAPEPAALAALDDAAYGFDRAVDHAYWSGGPGRGTLWLRGGEPCAYSYVWPGGRIGPLAGRDPAAAAHALRAELARAESPVAVLAPGSAATLVRVAVDAGLRFEKPPGLLLVGGDATVPMALAIGGYALF
ncbi:MAG TPA: GNAT family N-acetyltransferase [Gaiellaceae bacterium]